MREKVCEFFVGVFVYMSVLMCVGFCEICNRYIMIHHINILKKP